MKMNTTEKYIKKAVEESRKEFAGNNITNCNFEMNMQADGATQDLAKALLAQAEANEANSIAIMELAKSLKPIDACMIKLVEGRPAELSGVKV